MNTLPGTPGMLPTFKREVAKHQQFLVCPATKREDGKFWFNAEYGIVKTELHFMNVADILVDLKSQGFDFDAVQKLIEKEVAKQFEGAREDQGN
jgi:hypothetical protein